MTVDKHRNEPVAEVDRDHVKLAREARANMLAWKAEWERLVALVQEQIGDAFAATVDGEKVFTYRPKSTYRVKDMRDTYPELTEQYVVPKTEMVFDLERFVKSHPEIATQFQSREFREVA